jgi:phospholipid N-methyltransferase
VLKSRGIEQVDYFISGLPTPSLPVHVRRRMFVSIRRYLSPGGVFSNITEVPWFYLKYYKSVFQDVSFDLVAFNVPPGGVYHCRSIR